MKATIKLFKAIFLLTCLVLFSGVGISAQKNQSANKKPTFLSSAEVVFEFEKLLEQTENACDKNYLITYLASAALANGDTEKAKIYAEKLLAEIKNLPTN